MEFFRRLLAQLQTIWQGMTPVFRVLLVSASVLLLVALVLFGFYTFNVEYKPVISASLEEIPALRTRLNNRNIPNRLDSSGTTILVPSDRLAEARVELAGAGVTAGKGYEVFDESPLGMTPFVQNVNYTRALQAELARSIGQLEPVAQARVHIVRPEPSPFVREQKPTTASVVLKLKPGGRLDRSTSEAIVALVARAVEGLSPENVTVVDTRGRLLSDSQTSEGRVSNSQLEFRKQMENYLASKAEEILRHHLGVNKAIVRVAVDVNTQRVKERSEIYSPDGKVVQAERQMTQRTTLPARSPGGVVGTTSNVGRAAVGGAASSATTAQSGSSQSETIQTDYVVSKTSRDLEQQLNLLNRLTIAAMVDLSAAEVDGKKLTLADAQELIKQAVGFREGRDEIKVTDVSLGPKEETTDEQAAVAQTRVLQYVLTFVRNLSLLLGLLLVAILVILIVSRRRQAASTSTIAPQKEPTQPSPVVTETDELEEFRRLAETDPDRVARVLMMLMGTARAG